MSSRQYSMLLVTVENQCPAMYSRVTVRLTMLHLGIMYRASLNLFEPMLKSGNHGEQIFYYWADLLESCIIIKFEKN